MPSPKAVVLVSGGLDSATTLSIARQQGFECYVLSFDYGQKNRAELTAARHLAKQLGAKEQRIIKLDIGSLGGSALTDDNIAVPDFSDAKEIPVTYVPARNTVFLSIAIGWAEVLGAHDVFTGICAIDYSGYPDCRPEYLEALQKVANLATKTGVEGKPIQLHAPLLYLTKAETIRLGQANGVDYSVTVTCYQANENGEACGTCDSCTLRKRGFEKAQVPDVTRYFSPPLQRG